MINRVKAIFTIGFLISIFVMVPQFVQADSPLDIVTNQGEMMPYDGHDADYSFPSQIGYHDMSKGEIVPKFKEMPPAEGITPQLRTVLGNDDRQQVTNTASFPYSSVVFIVTTYANGESYVGSGAMISPDAVLTAGHVVFDPKLKQWPQEVKVYPAINGTMAPFGHTESTKLLALSGWTNELSSKHDLGLIRLAEPIGVNTGWFGLTSTVTPNTAIQTAGYPTDKPRQTMWKTSGMIKSMTDTNIFYDLDTYPGQSGSGVYNASNQILAVHAYSQPTQNFGTRLCPSILSWVQDDLQNVMSVYRMYNPNDGEHFYTKNPNEVENLKHAGWNSEGLAWYAPDKGAEVYRLYNPNTGDHHYTTNAGERDNLVHVGWRFEGVSWEASQGKGTPTYRLYNPNAQVGAHHYTINAQERANLIRAGWHDEGIAWYNL